MVLLILHCNAKLLSQDDFKLAEDELSSHTFSVAFHAGNLIPHYEFMEVYNEKTIKAFTLSAEKRIDDLWASNFKNFQRGIEIHHTSLGSKSVLGNATHALVYMRLGVLSGYKKDSLSSARGSIKLGGGLGLLTQRFDLETNHLNAVIGTHLNISMTAELSYRFKLKKKFCISPSIKFTHYSNAAFKKPNLGINLITVGVSFQNSVSNYAVQSETRKPFSKNKSLNAIMLLGFNSARILSKTYPNATVGVSYIKTKSKINYGGLLDVQFNQAYKNSEELNLDKSESWRASIGVLGGLQFGKSSLTADLGFYLRNQIPDLTPYYERLYFNHDVFNGLSLRVGIKAHGTVAETLEFGLTKTLVK